MHYIFYVRGVSVALDWADLSSPFSPSTFGFIEINCDALFAIAKKPLLVAYGENSNNFLAKKYKKWIFGFTLPHGE